MLRKSLCLAAFALLGCGDAGPTILSVTELHNTTSELGPYGVWATIVDDHEVKRVELHWRVGAGGEEPAVVMTALGDDVWYGELPGQPVGSKIEWYVAVSDGRADGIDTFPDDYAGHPLKFSVVAK